MDLFAIISILISFAAICSYLNYRFLRLPTAIGVMLLSLVVSLVLVLLASVGFGRLEVAADRLLGSINFDRTLLHGLLAFLLFAGSLHLDINDLASQRWIISLLATLGVVVSMFAVGFAFYGVAPLIGLHLPLIHCLIFGALISPTDPIAVLGILKSTGVPKSLQIKVAGESLFNDGIGVVVFLILLELAGGAEEVSVASVAGLFAQEAIGGAAFGLGIGYFTYRLLKSVDQYQVEILLTLAMTSGGYALADHLHVSGPIAIVVAGLMIGNHGRAFAMSERTREHLDRFWELVDEALNAVLFVLIGLELLVVPFDTSRLLLGLLAIPVVIVARLISVSAPIVGLGRLCRLDPGAIPILTWGGLRGGISVALALSLPATDERSTLLVATYAVVVFSILVQGMTIGKLVRWLQKRAAGA